MDLSKIEELIQIAKNAQVSELTIRQDGNCVTIKKTLGGAQPVAAKKAAAKKQQTSAQAQHSEAKLLAITAPMVGIFHAAGAQPVLPGVVVKPGQVVGAIESMKLMNEVISGVAGTVTEVDIEDGLPVEYGQILFHLAPLEVD